MIFIGMLQGKQLKFLYHSNTLEYILPFFNNLDKCIYPENIVLQIFYLTISAYYKGENG